jgi:hypothetical protein
MQPRVPLGWRAEPGLLGDLLGQQWHPGQRRERQVVLAPGGARGIPVDEADQRALGPHGVPRRRIQMGYHQSRPPRPAGEPHGVRGRPERRRRVVQPAQPRTDLPQRIVAPQPFRPRLRLAQGLPGQERQAFAAPVIEAAGARSAVEAGTFQMRQYRLHGRRPRLGGAAHLVADADGAETAPTRQPPFGHLPVLPHQDFADDRIIGSAAPVGDEAGAVNPYGADAFQRAGDRTGRFANGHWRHQADGSGATRRSPRAERR